MFTKNASPRAKGFLEITWEFPLHITGSNCVIEPVLDKSYFDISKFKLSCKSAFISHQIETNLNLLGPFIAEKFLVRPRWYEYCGVRFPYLSY